MDLIGIFGAVAGVVVTIALAAIGFFVAWGKINQKVDDLQARVDEQSNDIEEAQKAAAQSQGVGAAIEHLAENVKTELKHIAEMFALNNQHVTTQLADIKDQLKSVRTTTTTSRVRRVG